MKTEDNYIVNEDFTDKENDYYVVFKTPSGEIKRIDKVEKIQLRTVHDDVLELKVTYNKSQRIYHYVGDSVYLLDHFDIGFE